MGGFERLSWGVLRTRTAVKTTRARVMVPIFRVSEYSALHSRSPVGAYRDLHPLVPLEVKLSQFPKDASGEIWRRIYVEGKCFNIGYGHQAEIDPKRPFGA